MRKEPLELRIEKRIAKFTTARRTLCELRSTATDQLKLSGEYPPRNANIRISRSFNRDVFPLANQSPPLFTFDSIPCDSIQTRSAFDSKLVRSWESPAKPSEIRREKITSDR